VFFDGDQSLQVENPNADSIADSHFIRRRKQIRKGEVLPDGGQQIDRTVTRYQIDMAARGKMAFGRPQLSLRPKAEDGVNISQEMY